MFVVIFLTTISLWWLTNKVLAVKKIAALPSPPKKLLFMGHLHHVLGGLKNITRLIKLLQIEYEGIVALWFGLKPFVIVYNAKDMQEIVSNSKILPKGRTYDFLRPWLGESILISEGEKFHDNKKIIMKAFNGNNLLSFLPNFNENARNLVQSMSQHVDQGEFPADKYIAVGAMFNLLGTTMGVHRNLLTKEEAYSYSEAIEKIGTYVCERTLKFWLHSSLIFKMSNLKKRQDQVLAVLNRLTEKVIDEKKTEHLRAPVERTVDFLGNFFSSVKRNGENYSNNEIKDEVMTMMFAGQDTTTITIGFTLSLLGIYEDVQEKLYDELENIFGCSNRDVTFEDTQKMVYLEQVIQESWRLFPPISTISRTPLTDVKLGKYTIPKGTTIICSIFMLHRNPDYFQRPNKFNPDNFLPDKIKARPQFSFLPFSHGSRKCIGSKYAMLVVKVFLATILRNYRIKCNQQVKDFKLQLQLNIRRKEGFLMELHKRQRNRCE